MSSILVYSQHVTSYSSTVISHDINLIAGNNVYFHDQIQNERTYPATITEVIHSGTPDLEGITISIHEVEHTDSKSFPGNEIILPITVKPGEVFDFFICYDTHVALKPNTYHLKTQFKMEPVEDTPPSLSICKPQSHSLYVFNHKIHSHFHFKTMIVGPIDITIESLDESGINHVEIYINDNLKTRIYSEPFSYRWDNPSFGCHSIRIDAYDNYDNLNSKTIRVFKIF